MEDGVTCWALQSHWQGSLLGHYLKQEIYQDMNTGCYIIYFISVVFQKLAKFAFLILVHFLLIFKMFFYIYKQIHMNKDNSISL